MLEGQQNSSVQQSDFYGAWNKLYGIMLDNQRRMLSGGLYDECIMTRVPPKYATYCGEVDCASCDMQESCLPWNVPQVAAYNVLHLTSEVSEILQADKRWKSIRKDHVDMQNKAEEIADCFICLFNVAIWSGMDSQDLIGAIVNKAEIYHERIQAEIEKKNQR